MLIQGFGDVYHMYIQIILDSVKVFRERPAHSVHRMFSLYFIHS